MKIVILNGSARKNGATASILRLIENNLKEHGAQIFYYDLCEQNITPCLGCCACYKLGHCVIDDDADMISAQIESADGIVIGSSTFASNVTGILKTFIDRGHFVIEQLLHGKYALCVTTYENYGGKDALKVIKSLVTLSGADLTGAYSYKTPFNSKVMSNTELISKISRLSLKLFKSIKNT
jgi:multimeric flavodoxin WrbA